MRDTRLNGECCGNLVSDIGALKLCYKKIYKYETWTIYIKTSNHGFHPLLKVKMELLFYSQAVPQSLSFFKANSQAHSQSLTIS